MNEIYLKRKTILLLHLIPFLIISPLFGKNNKILSPEEFFGFKVGADFHLLNYEQALDYWKRLEEASGKIKLIEYGFSSFGRPMVLAIISAEENMAKLEDYKNLSKRLSLVRDVDESEAKKLSKEGKIIVWIDGGLHATEVAPAQHLIQLAYDLVSDDSEENERILREAIVMLSFPNPDGMDMVSEWYHQNLGTPYEASPLPWLYQKYIGHDNNRDSFMLSVPETKNINRIIHHEWYPHVFYNHHQTSPFPSLIFVPPDCEPTNPNLHPLLLRWQNFIGTAIALAFEAEGKQGVISRFLFDTWYPGYITQICDFHNIISTFSETFLYRYATPHFYTMDDFPEEYRDFTISLFFTNPWKGGWWRLRDAVEYCLTASKAVLKLSAQQREEILYSKYAMGKETIERFKKEPPYGWIIPLNQKDPVVTSQLLELLIELDLEVYQAEEEFKADGLIYPKGTFILPTSQPFGRLLKTLFEIQVYPDLRKYPSLWQGIVEPLKLNIPPLRTYDVLGWTLPLQMGVKTVQLNNPLEAKMKRIKNVVYPQGKIKGSGSHSFILAYETNNEVIALNRLLKEGIEPLWAAESFALEGMVFSPGAVIIPGDKVSLGQIEKLSRELKIQVERVSHLPSFKTHRIKKPRLALYRPWVANMDEGWTSLILEKHEFPFTTLHDSEIRAGRLFERFDVIIFADQDKDSILNGHPKGTMPPQYTGGISSEGLRNLKDFIEEGGTLIMLGSACDLALEEFRLPLRNILKSLNKEEFFASGLLLRVLLDTNNPVAYGLPQEVSGYYAQSPTFQVFPGAGEKSKIISTYPEENLILSGWMVGEEYLRNKAAAVEVSEGKGRFILLGFRVQHRGQTVGTFKLLFNSIFYGAMRG